MRDRFLSVECSLFEIGNFVQNQSVMTPRNLSHKLWDFFRCPPVEAVPLANVGEIGAREPLDVGELRLEISRELSQESTPPPGVLLTLINHLAEVPVEGE